MKTARESELEMAVNDWLYYSRNELPEFHDNKRCSAIRGGDLCGDHRCDNTGCIRMKIKLAKQALKTKGIQ